MQRVLEIINKNSFVYTAAQFGIDTQMSKSLLEYYDPVVFFDEDGEWAWKVTPDHPNSETNLWFDEEDFWTTWDYLELEYDLIYIHDRGSPDLKRNIFQKACSLRTKFIMTHPAVITFHATGYKKINFSIDNEDYKLFYIDTIQEGFETAFSD